MMGVVPGRERSERDRNPTNPTGSMDSGLTQERGNDERWISPIRNALIRGHRLGSGQVPFRLQVIRRERILPRGPTGALFRVRNAADRAGVIRCTLVGD